MQQLFVSYPRSGRTWIRFMLDDYLCRLHGLETDNVFTVEEKLGAEYPVTWTHMTSALFLAQPYWDLGRASWEQLRGVRCVLLARNFYATLASCYRQAVHHLGSFEGTPGEFLHSPVYGVARLVTFHNLCHQLRSEGIGTWATFRYERFKADPAGELRRLLAQLGLAVDDQALEAALEEGDLDRMKRAARSRAYAGSPLAPSDPVDPDGRRSAIGGRGDDRTLFSDGDLDYIDRVIDDLLLARDDPFFAGCWRRAPEPARNGGAYAAGAAA